MKFSQTAQLILLGAALASAGCVSLSEPTPKDPVNSAAYVVNMLESRVDDSLDDVIDAFDEVMEGRNFVRTDIDEVEGAAVLTYRGPGDLGVEVKLKRFPEFTNIKIRYGLTGDEYQSRSILGAVVEEL